MSDDTARLGSGQLDQRAQPLIDGRGHCASGQRHRAWASSPRRFERRRPAHSAGQRLATADAVLGRVLILVAFLGFSLFMILNADASDPVWKNRLAIFTVLQAIVYTAVGWFGREVNRGTKEAAEKSADAAKADADRAKAEAADAKAAERQQAAARADSLERHQRRKSAGRRWPPRCWLGRPRVRCPPASGTSPSAVRLQTLPPTRCGPWPPVSTPIWLPDGDLGGRTWTT